MQDRELQESETVARSHSPEWARLYTRALQRHLSTPSESTLAAAYELGRDGVWAGLGEVEVCAIHHDALRALRESRDERLTAAGEFLAETLAPYEMLQRGFRETIREQGALNRELERRAQALSDANDTIARLRRERSVFIAEASHELATSLDFDQVAKTIVKLAVPRLAKWAAVDVDGRGDLRRAAEAGEAGSERPRALEMKVGSRLVAVLSLARHADDAHPDREELLTEFAARAGLALDNARLFAEAKEAVQLRDEFLSIASHELNTPLTPLLLGLRAIRPAVEKGGDDRHVQALDRSIRQVQRLKLLVQDMLDGARIQTGRFDLQCRPFDLRDTVRDTVAAFSRDPRGARLDVEVPSSPLTVCADAFRIEQVVVNLVDNAIKYGPAGGIVEVLATSNDGRAVVSVRDHGIGIPEDQRAMVFEPFFRARNAPTHHYGGLGLGLHICSEIINRHDGQIWVEGAPDGGAVFSFALPTCQTSTEEA